MSRARALVALIGTAALGIAAATSSAQQTESNDAISILATNAITGPLTAIAAEHERRTGQRAEPNPKVD